MTYEQAATLAKSIQDEFPHTEAMLVQSTDMRNAPSNFFVAVRRKDALEGMALHIHGLYEWEIAQAALYVLSA